MLRQQASSLYLQHWNALTVPAEEIRGAKLALSLAHPLRMKKNTLRPALLVLAASALAKGDSPGA